MSMTNWTVRLAAGFVVVLAGLSPVPAEASGVGRLVQQLSAYGGRFYLTQVESGVSLSRSLLGRSVADQADYLRLVRAVESGRVSQAELSRMSREIREIDREAGMLLKGRESASVRFAVYERATLSAGLGLETQDSMRRLAKFFPSAPLKGSLLSARAELVAAGRAVPDREAVRVLEATAEKRAVLELKRIETNWTAGRKSEIFEGTLKTERGVERLEAELVYREAGSAGATNWKPDGRSPLKLRSTAWGEGKEVELHLHSSRPRYVIVGSAGPNLGVAHAYQELTYIGQFAEAERPLEVIARIRARKVTGPHGRENLDFGSAALEIEAGPLRTGY